jgi:hypothetical protein
MREEIAQRMFGKRYNDLTPIQKKAVNTKMVRANKTPEVKKSGGKNLLVSIIHNLIRKEYNG